MKPIYIMLYSGGVDGILTLKKIVEDGITPFIFHFHTLKLTQKHERMIRKTARLISPESPFYVFKTKTFGFEACIEPFPHLYSVKINRKRSFFPLRQGDFLVAGYMRWIYAFHKSKRKYKPRQAEFYRECEIYGFPFILPLLDYSREQVDEEFRRLPMTVRENTVSSTRDYDYGGGVFVHEHPIPIVDTLKINQKKREERFSGGGLR